MSEDTLPGTPRNPDGPGPGPRTRPVTAARPAHPHWHLPWHPHLTPALGALAATVTGYALIAGSFRRLTWPAELGTFLAGALITYLALRRDQQRRPAPRRLDGRGVLAWGALLVVFGVWELYADFRGSTPDHPTLSILMGPILDEPWYRAAGYVLWLATGVWLVRR